mmetsp:Transcript_6732/g.6041  ORF Transcript_6732/g.6041 Transcript_6732/m.6041 type:complete len:125 (+) Transcript_6732:1723-2097(+)
MHKVHQEENSLKRNDKTNDDEGAVQFTCPENIEVKEVPFERQNIEVDDEKLNLTYDEKDPNNGKNGHNGRKNSLISTEQDVQYKSPPKVPGEEHDSAVVRDDTFDHAPKIEYQGGIRITHKPGT